MENILLWLIWWIISINIIFAGITFILLPIAIHAFPVIYKRLVNGAYHYLAAEETVRHENVFDLTLEVLLTVRDPTNGVLRLVLRHRQLLFQIFQMVQYFRLWKTNLKLFINTIVIEYVATTYLAEAIVEPPNNQRGTCVHSGIWKTVSSEDTPHRWRTAPEPRWWPIDCGMFAACCEPAQPIWPNPPCPSAAPGSWCCTPWVIHKSLPWSGRSSGSPKNTVADLRCVGDRTPWVFAGPLGRFPVSREFPARQWWATTFCGDIYRTAAMR